MPHKLAHFVAVIKNGDLTVPRKKMKYVERGHMHGIHVDDGDTSSELASYVQSAEASLRWLADAKAKLRAEIDLLPKRAYTMEVLVGMRDVLAILEGI